jgi:Uma2 family endonuclease
MSTTQNTITTAQELLKATGLGRCELVRGQLKMMSPAGFEHGAIVAQITGPFQVFVRQHDLGIVTGAETGFYIERDPDTVRAPDLGFLKKDRLPESRVRAFFPGAPDLAVEVVSPDDRKREVLAKVQNWLETGCTLVWVVDPDKRTLVA